MSEQQQNLFGLFSPEPGVHKAPPAEGEHVVFERSARARHYRLTLRRDGTAVAIIPVRGSVREAERFVAKHSDWLDRARARQARRPRGAEVWAIGTRVLWRGEMCEIRAASGSLRRDQATSIGARSQNSRAWRSTWESSRCRASRKNCSKTA